MAEARKLQKGSITAEQFVDDCEMICLDVSVSALAALLGTYLIPVPILGSVIGSITGTFMLNIAKTYLTAYEEKLIREYLKEYEQSIEESREEFQKVSSELKMELSRFGSLIEYSFSSNANKRLELSVEIAQFTGVEENRILKDIEEIDEFFC